MTPEELKLLVKVPINTLDNVSGIPDGKIPFYDGSGKLKLMDVGNFNNISKSAKPISPTDAEPTEEGLYVPTISGTYSNLDGLIAQEGYYTLFFFDGTTWTKSETKLPELIPFTNTLYKGVKGNISDILTDGGVFTIDSNGLNINSGAVTLEKPTNLNERYIELTVKMRSDSKFFIGTKNVESNVNKAYTVVDFASKKLEIYNLDSNVIATSKTFNIDIADNRLYIFRMYKINEITKLEILDTVTSKSDYIEIAQSGQFDKYRFGLISSSNPVIISEISIKSMLSERPYVGYYGDSNTEAGITGSLTDLPFYKNRFADLIGENLRKPYYVSARSGGNIDGVLLRMQTELPVLLPKYVYVTIGTNGGNTEAKLNQLVDYCEGLGIEVILNRIPLFDASTSAKNAMIESVVDARNLLSVRFDLATSINNDGITKNTDLYYSELDSYLHLNISGHKAIFKRSEIDLLNFFSDAVKPNLVTYDFDKNNSRDPQGGKQINDYFLGSTTEFNQKLVNTAIDNNWQTVSVAGFNSIIIPVKNKDVLKISGLNTTNSIVGMAFKKNGLKISCDFPILNAEFAVPEGFTDFAVSVNGDQGWILEKVTSGAIKNAETRITEKNIATDWTEGSLSGVGQPVQIAGYFRMIILTNSFSYISFENLQGAFLKLYRNDRQLTEIEIQDNVLYSTEGYTYFCVVRAGNPTGNEVIKGGQDLNKVFTPYLDLIEFGVIPGADVDNATRDFNTQKIDEAVIRVLNNGGGTLYMRNEKIKVSKITVPVSDIWRKVEFAGAEMPVPIFGTVGAYSNDMPLTQAELISDLQDPTKGVINVDDGNIAEGFNYIFLSVKNLRVRTYQNPNCHGINAAKAIQLNVENVHVDTGVYNVLCVEPTHGTTAIVTPQNNNAAFNYLRYASVVGFHSGIDVFEHTDGDQIIAHSCKNGLTFKSANHASYFKRVLMQRCRDYVTVEGSHLFEIAQLNMEYVGTNQYDASNAWQRARFQINDPNNLGVGSINWANVRGNVIGSSPYISINGGANIIIKRVGAENRLFAPGNPDPNPA